ncbi:MAG TPA: ester cyclase [Jatrophihabitans sp.]|nr:ester cyclase [Jatrophihabitans sp.]
MTDNGLHAGAATSAAPADQDAAARGDSAGQPVRPIQAATLSDRPSGRQMPTGYEIAVRPGTGSGTLRADRERGERRQSMRGFEDTYVDIVDYIIRITHRIWEDQDAGYIYDTYSPGCFVYDDSGPNYGVERVVEGTIASIHAFPDTRSWADEIIWAGNDEQGFVTSHRYITTGHHLGAWRWGPATGRKVNLWGIANCVIRENEIFEEWVLYNMTSKFMQLGIDVGWAAREYGNELNRIGADRHVGEVQRLEGGRQPEYYPQASSDAGSPSFDVEHFVRALWHNLYNRRDLSAVDRAYAPTVRWKATSNRLGYGRSDVQAMARGLLATFPDLGMQVDEVYWMGNAAEGFRVSVRWSAQGTHRGYALYGNPTGRRVHLWGINQLYISGGRITEDWLMFNEFDVLAQLLSEEPATMLS